MEIESVDRKDAKKVLSVVNAADIVLVRNGKRCTCTSGNRGAKRVPNKARDVRLFSSSGGG